MKCSLAKDLLTSLEIAEVTGVPDRAHKCIERRLAVLRKAGIYCWLGADGSIKTTWHHVHQAGCDQHSQKTAPMPKFERVK